MYFEKIDHGYLLRLEVGEEVQESIKRFAIEKEIKGAFYHGIGGVKQVTIGYYQRMKKDYKRILMENELEMVSLNGNIALYEGRIVVHSHACFGDENGHAYAGHLIQATVAFTVEMILYTTSIPLEKKSIEDLGIKVFDFSSKL